MAEVTVEGELAGSAADRLRALPAVGRLLEQWPPPVPPQAATALRSVLGELRAEMLAGGPAAKPGDILRRAMDLLDARSRPVLRPVINATGIILHTNLGRAPLPEAAVQAVAAVARGYCNLELDIATGRRGSRLAGVEPLLCELTGAEAGLAVNNCAAAVLLALAGLAGGGEVVVSRGELVEIGGGFRIPDVIVQGGARLVEVGTTNRTRLADYRAAIGPATRVLLKVHQSNYRIVGFTEAVGLDELAGLAGQTGLLVVHDLGSGALGPLGPVPEPEPTPRESIAAGADVVAFSGDKLGGGPQAGLLVGKAAPIALLRQHPLMRALRLDKMTLAALEATLRLHGADAAALPALRMLRQGVAELADRAARLCALLGPPARAEPCDGYAGGGTLPASAIPSYAAVLTVPDPDGLARRLRQHHPAVVGRIAEGAVWLDVLAVRDDELGAIADAVAAARA